MTNDRPYDQHFSQLILISKKCFSIKVHLEKTRKICSQCSFLLNLLSLEKVHRTTTDGTGLQSPSISPAAEPLSNWSNCCIGLFKSLNGKVSIIIRSMYNRPLSYMKNKQTNKIIAQSKSGLFYSYYSVTQKALGGSFSHWRVDATASSITFPLIVK